MRRFKFDWPSYLVGAAIVFVFAAVNAFVLHRCRPYQYLEEINFDSWVRENLVAPSGKIHLFVIDDAGYKTSFSNRSPLEPGIICQLIQVASEGGANVIGVDIDTSEWQASDWHAAKTKKATPIVWADTGADRSDGRCMGSVEVAPAKVEAWGQRNETGIIRTHPEPKSPVFSDLLERAFQSGNTADCGVVRAEAAGESGNAAFIRFVKRSTAGPGSVEPAFTTWSMGSLPLGDDHSPERESWGKTRPVEGKIVLIGGTAQKLHDYHETPLGLESGVGLQAELVDSRLSGGNMHPIPESKIFLVDLLVGLLVLTAVSFTRTALGVAATLIGCAAILAFLSFLLFRWSGLFLGFITVFLGILLHKFGEFYWEHRHCHPHH